MAKKKLETMTPSYIGENKIAIRGKPWWMQLLDKKQSRVGYAGATTKWQQENAERNKKAAAEQEKKKAHKAAIMKKFGELAAEDKRLAADVHIPDPIWAEICASQAIGNNNEIQLYGVIDDRTIVFVNKVRVGHGASVTVGETVMSEAIQESLAAGFGTINTHIHTHPGFSPFFSATDIQDHSEQIATITDMGIPNAELWFACLSGFKGVIRRYIIKKQEDGTHSIKYKDGKLSISDRLNQPLRAGYQRTHATYSTGTGYDFDELHYPYQYYHRGGSNQPAGKKTTGQGTPSQTQGGPPLTDMPAAYKQAEIDWKKSLIARSKLCESETPRTDDDGKVYCKHCKDAQLVLWTVEQDDRGNVFEKYKCEQCGMFYRVLGYSESGGAINYKDMLDEIMVCEVCTTADGHAVNLEARSPENPPDEGRTDVFVTSNGHQYLLFKCPVCKDEYELFDSGLVMRLVCDVNGEEECWIPASYTDDPCADDVVAWHDETRDIAELSFCNPDVIFWDLLYHEKKRDDVLKAWLRINDPQDQYSEYVTWVLGKDYKEEVNEPA